MPAMLILIESEKALKEKSMQPSGWGSILLPKTLLRKAAPSPKNTAISARESVPTAQPVTYRLLGVTRRLGDT